MLQITKTDLRDASIYSWKVIPGDDPAVKGRPDSTLLNTGEGYEVLHFINSFLSKNCSKFLNGENLKPTALKIEKLIHKAKAHNRTRADYRQWIIDNWATA